MGGSASNRSGDGDGFIVCGDGDALRCCTSLGSLNGEGDGDGVGHGVEMGMRCNYIDA